MIFYRAGMVWLYRCITGKSQEYLEMLNNTSNWNTTESHWIVPGTWKV